MFRPLPQGFQLFYKRLCWTFVYILFTLIHLIVHNLPLNLFRLAIASLRVNFRGGACIGGTRRSGAGAGGWSGRLIMRLSRLPSAFNV